MANSKLKEIAEEDHDMEMTPMIDVTFLLLIFFMCTIKFKTLEGKLAAFLPKDVGVNASPAEEPPQKVEIVIRVAEGGTKRIPRGYPGAGGVWTGQGRFEIEEGTRRLKYSIGPKNFTDVDALGRRLAEIHRTDPERPATIDSRKGTVYADVIEVLDAAIEAEFTEITFVGSYE
jgi:biopolymer transport protein ExbD